MPQGIKNLIIFDALRRQADESEVSLMKKPKTIAVFTKLYILNALYSIVSHIPFVKLVTTAPLLRNIMDKGQKLYIKLGPAYHIGIRSTRVPSRFRVQLYQEPDKETREKTHSEIAQRREQRIANQAVNGCDQ